MNVEKALRHLRDADMCVKLAACAAGASSATG
jgi:hypothetical protein